MTGRHQCRDSYKDYTNVLARFNTFYVNSRLLQLWFAVLPILSNSIVLELGQETETGCKPTPPIIQTYLEEKTKVNSKSITH